MYHFSVILNTHKSSYDGVSVEMFLLDGNNEEKCIVQRSKKNNYEQKSMKSVKHPSYAVINKYIINSWITTCS
jgi:hypothetical protein